MDELPKIEYVGTTTIEEIREAIGLVSLFLGHIGTIDFETAQKIAFMRLQFEALYGQMLPFIEMIESFEKESSTASGTLEK